MIILFPKEKRQIDMVVAKYPQSGAVLQEALTKVIAHLPEKLLNEKYNSKITEEFLRNLVHYTQKMGLEKYDEVVVEDQTLHALKEKCLAPEELEHGILKSLGSYGLTKLIGSFLEKMAEKDFGKKEIKHLMTLIEARNRMRQAEEKFLNSAFKAYLKKQLSLYNS